MIQKFEEPLALATVIQVQAPTSARPGDKALVSAAGIADGWVGGGCVQPSVVKAARTVLQSGRNCLLRVAPNGTWSEVDGVADFSSHCLGEGSLLVFVESLNAQPRLCVLGNSAVAHSLALQAVHMDFKVTLCGGDVSALDCPAQLQCESDFNAVDADYIVVATQGQQDRKAIDAALACERASIQMVVSEKKLQGLKARLKNDAYTDEQLMRIQGPAGLRIGAKLPAEIALSVLAELVQLRREDLSKDVSPSGDGSKCGDVTKSDDVTRSGNEMMSSALSKQGGCCGD